MKKLSIIFLSLSISTSALAGQLIQSSLGSSGGGATCGGYPCTNVNVYCGGSGSLSCNTPNGTLTVNSGNVGGPGSCAICSGGSVQYHQLKIPKGGSRP